MFAPNSRYVATPTAELTTRDGRTLVYLRRRFVPPPEASTTLTEHVVSEGERLDHIATRYIGDPEQFWRICDANAALRPGDLTAPPGRRFRIALPDGIPAQSGG